MTIPYDAAGLFYQQSGRGYTNPQKYNYSFSGTDAKVFAYYLGLESQILQMDSFHTISISVHEAKGQVRSLGHRGIRGMTRSVRTVAGSIIARVIREHPLAPLARISSEHPILRGWSIDHMENGTGSAFDIYDYSIRLGTMIPPFNLLFELSSESGSSTVQKGVIDVGTASNPQDTRGVLNKVEAKGQVSNTRLFNGASMMLEGVEIIDEGITVSVNDIMTEMTFTYVAKNFRPISDNLFAANGAKALSLNMIRQREMDLHEMLSNPGGRATGIPDRGGTVEIEYSGVDFKGNVTGKLDEDN